MKLGFAFHLHAYFCLIFIGGREEVLLSMGSMFSVYLEGPARRAFFCSEGVPLQQTVRFS